VEKSKKHQDNDSSSDEEFRLLQSLPLHVLRINKQLHAEAKRELLLYIKATRLVLNCSYAGLLKFFQSVPNYVTENVKRLYVTSRLLFSYHSDSIKFAWKRSIAEERTPFCQRILQNFTLEDFAIYVPLTTVSYYCQNPPREICHMLETGKIQRAQFVYRDLIEKDQDCEKLVQVEQVLRGAYKYPDDTNRHKTPCEYSETIAQWQELPQIFNVRREDGGACQDELWWAASEVLTEKYSADYLKHNGVRTIVSLTRRDDLTSATR
jgi:hypothetical protein